jgi:hypothetical protein
MSRLADLVIEADLNIEADFKEPHPPAWLVELIPPVCSKRRSLKRCLRFLVVRRQSVNWTE